jgi:glycosyltransferase involved in cell wall biosynthesis
MCEALSSLHEVNFFHPFLFQRTLKERLSFFSIKKRFPITRIVAFGPLKNKYLDYANRIIFFFQILFYLYFCKYDLIYTRDFSFLVFIYWLPKFLRPKKKLIYEPHKIYYYSSDKVNDLRLEIECVKLPDKLIAISDGVRQDLIQLGVDREKIAVIPSGAKVDKFVIEFDVDAFRKQNGISNRDVTITYTGSFELWKGVDVLIKAFATVLKKVENCKLVLVGGGARDLIKARELIKGLEICAERILLIGFVSQSEVAKYLKISDIGVIPTVGTSIGLRYTSPLKLFEYIAAGLPIVISDLPSAREILKEDQAVFFESENDNDLADKLVNLIHDKEKRERLGFLMSQMARDFTYEQRCQKVTKVIDSAM